MLSSGSSSLIELAAGWAPGPVWKGMEKRKSLPPPPPNRDSHAGLSSP
jgi:hypothetical protein